MTYLLLAALALPAITKGDCPERAQVLGLDGAKMAYVQTRFRGCPMRVFTATFALPNTLNLGPRYW